MPTVAGNRVGSDNMSQGVKIYNMCLRIALGSRKEFREELLSHQERERDCASGIHLHLGIQT